MLLKRFILQQASSLPDSIPSNHMWLLVQQASARPSCSATCCRHCRARTPWLLKWEWAPSPTPRTFHKREPQQVSQRPPRT